MNPVALGRRRQTALERVAGRLPAAPVALPLPMGAQGGVLWVLGVCPDEAAVFSTNKRAPFKCVVEVNSPHPGGGWWWWGNVCVWWWWWGNMCAS